MEMRSLWLLIYNSGEPTPGLQGLSLTQSRSNPMMIEFKHENSEASNQKLVNIYLFCFLAEQVPHCFKSPNFKNIDNIYATTIGFICILVISDSIYLLTQINCRYQNYNFSELQST